MADRREFEGDGFIAWSERPGTVTIQLQGFVDGKRTDGRPFTGPIKIDFLNDVANEAHKNDGGRFKPRGGG